MIPTFLFNKFKNNTNIIYSAIIKINKQYKLDFNADSLKDFFVAWICFENRINAYLQREELEKTNGNKFNRMKVFMSSNSSRDSPISSQELCIIKSAISKSILRSEISGKEDFRCDSQELVTSRESSCSSITINKIEKSLVEDNNTLYCFCRLQPIIEVGVGEVTNIRKNVMIQCESCYDWFHPSCVNATASDSEIFNCPICDILYHNRVGNFAYYSIENKVKVSVDSTKVVEITSDSTILVASEQNDEAKIVIPIIDSILTYRITAAIEKENCLIISEVLVFSLTVINSC
jgi:hypothetical protein